MAIQAMPFVPSPPEKVSYIVDKCCDHRPWFHDKIWEPPEVRRGAAITYLSDSYANGKIWEAWKDGELVGILILNDVITGISAQCHFIFFDHVLVDKKGICLGCLQSVFADESLDLEVLRVELPVYVAKLAGFLRKALGFKYENERNVHSVREAKRTSLKHRATLWRGNWHDALLLSVTKDEFAAFLATKADDGRTKGQEGGCLDSTDRGADGPTDSDVEPVRIDGESPEQPELCGTTERIDGPVAERVHEYVEPANGPIPHT
jgi:hypothetical protein